MVAQEYNNLHTGRTAQQAIHTARAWESLGEKTRAMVSAGRYPVWTTEAMPYLSQQVREQARLAALAGNRKRAIRSYRHFLGMRVVAEPGTKPQVDSARAELARLEGRR